MHPRKLKKSFPDLEAIHNRHHIDLIKVATDFVHRIKNRWNELILLMDIF